MISVAIKIRTVDDLRAWAESALHFDQSPEETEAIVEYVRRLPDRPAWGGDWSQFLADLICERLLDTTT